MNRRPDIPLAVRLPNWVGDACMALPALAALRRAGFALRVFGKGWAGDLLAAYPDRVVRLPAGVLAQASALGDAGAIRGVLFTNSFGRALAMRLAGIDAVGYGHEGRSFLLGRRAPRPGGHEVDAFWRLALAACGDDAAWDYGVGQPDRRWPRPPRRLGLQLTTAHRAAAAAALATAGVAPGYVVLCPLAVGTIAGRSKQWPGFPVLARDLLAAGRQVVACPGPGEEAACAAAAPGAALLPGLGLGAYAAVLAGAAAVLANDSGPLHLAAAVDAPVLGVFGVGDPRRTRPWGPRAGFVGSAAGWPEPSQVRAALAALLERAP